MLKAIKADVHNLSDKLNIIYLNIVNRGNGFEIRLKVLCCWFLFAILEVDRARNLAKYNRWLPVFMQLTKKTLRSV